MPDIQFDRGHVNAQGAATGRFGGGEFARSVEGEDGELTFEDFLDVINPLQHIPVISTLYREITGDEISGPARIVGGTLFGGPGGFVSAIANTLFDEATGNDVGESLLALFDDEAEDGQLADKAPSSTASEAMTAVPLETAAGTGAPAISPAAAAAPGGGYPAGLIPASLVPSASLNATSTSLPQETLHPNPPPSPGVLTGQNALNALYNDLRGPAPPRPAPAVAAPAQPAPSPRQQQSVTPEAPPLGSAGKGSGDDLQAQRADKESPVAPGDAAANPLILAAQAPDAALADQMLTALDKYRAMTERRQQEQARERAERTADQQFEPAVP